MKRIPLQKFSWVIFLLPFLSMLSLKAENKEYLQKTTLQPTILSITEVASNEVATVHEIQLSTGKSVFQVTSGFMRNRIPLMVGTYACVATLKLPRLVCSGLVRMCVGFINNRSSINSYTNRINKLDMASTSFQSLWALKSLGSIMQAEIVYELREEAEEAIGVMASMAKEKFFPWEKSEFQIVPFTNWASPISPNRPADTADKQKTTPSLWNNSGGNLELICDVLVTWPLSIAPVAQSMYQVFRELYARTKGLFTSKIISSPKPTSIPGTKISGILENYKEIAGASHASNVYPRSAIDHVLESTLRTFYRVSENEVIAGALNNVSWYSAFKKFDYGFVFTERGVIIRQGNPDYWLNPDLKYISWSEIKSYGTLSWTDTSVLIGDLKINVKATGLQPAEVSKILHDIAMYDM
ncbi:MAG: hypothetical protein R3D00_14450 [Bacteroidia bacterium]